MNVKALVGSADRQGSGILAEEFYRDVEIKTATFNGTPGFLASNC